MMIEAGARLGPYEVVGALGAGGMGEVYRARDTKLGREVALKVLPEEFASNPERMGRFEREAKVLASLNHPNIAAIYGFEDSGSVHALAMELVEGQTLAEVIAGGQTRSRISSGSGSSSPGTPGTGQSARAGVPAPRKALPFDEALPIAKQIAEGLEYAHERGIVHRDLKPANVKITPDGVVKILDFGLAKALSGETAAADPSTSPTLSHLATQAGIILGTASYMAPEQAKGKPVDRRADVWAFGCVLYEMLTGKPAFDGETVTDILAAVVKSDPDWHLLPGDIPPRIRELLRRCLTKDLRQRLQSVGEARITIEKTIAGPAEAETAAIADSTSRPRHNVYAWSLVALLALIAAGSVAWAWIASRTATAPAASAIVSDILPPPGANFVSGAFDVGSLAISPDGKWLAFAAAGSDGKQELWVRPLGGSAARPLSGTDGATFPFWSPDSRSIGFFANGKLERIDAAGGPPLMLADAPVGRGGAWSQNGTILFTPSTGSPLFRVSALGGTPRQATKLDASRQEMSNRWPQFLPDGKHFLFYAPPHASEGGGTFATSLSGGTPRFLVRGNSNALYAAPGYLLFVRQGTLMAQRFDAANLRLIGGAVPLAEHAEVNSNDWRGVFTISQNGVLVYLAGGALNLYSELLWFDRSGKQIGEIGAPGDYLTPTLSPNGRRLAVAVFSPGTDASNIWVYDLAGGTRTRLTFSSHSTMRPAWSPDGKTIVFSSMAGGQPHLYEKAANGAGVTLPLVHDNASEDLATVSANGRYLVYDRLAAQRGSHTEIWAMPLFGNRKPFPVVRSPQFGANQPALSPDGKWLAYVSNESGQREIYIVPFLHGTGKWQVSSAGGTWPRWGRGGEEIYYLSAGYELMAAKISEKNASVVIGKVSPLFQTKAGPTFLSVGRPFDVTRDGKKFLVDTPVNQKGSEPLTLVVNWPALLKGQR